MSLFSGRIPYDRVQALKEAGRCRAKGRLTRAIDWYRRVLVMEPNAAGNAEIHTRLAPLLASTGHDLDAWTSYRIAARAHLAARRPERALALYKEAARLLPRQLETWRAAARLELKLGRRREAFDTLVEARRWFTSQPTLPHAISLLRRALSLEPRDHEVALDLARTLARAQQRFEAVVLLDELALRCDGTALRRLAAARFKITGSVADALRWLRCCLGGFTGGERARLLARSAVGK